MDNKIKKLRNSRNYYKSLYKKYREFLHHSSFLLEEYCKPNKIKLENKEMYSHLKKVRSLIRTIKRIESREEKLRNLILSLEEEDGQ